MTHAPPGFLRNTVNVYPERCIAAPSEFIRYLCHCPFPLAIFRVKIRRGRFPAVRLFPIRSFVPKVLPRVYGRNESPHQIVGKGSPQNNDSSVLYPDDKSRLLRVPKGLVRDLWPKLRCHERSTGTSVCQFHAAATR